MNATKGYDKELHISDVGVESGKCNPYPNTTNYPSPNYAQQGKYT